MSNILPTTYTIPFFVISDLSEPLQPQIPHNSWCSFHKKNGASLTIWPE